MLKNKAYKEYVDSIDTRMEAVRSFLKKFNPRLDFNVFELIEPCGVGATLPEIQACVLTREVEKGGLMINNIRREKGFP
jgi:phosphopantetheine adenylyltransferase